MLREAPKCTKMLMVIRNIKKNIVHHINLVTGLCAGLLLGVTANTLFTIVGLRLSGLIGTRPHPATRP